MPSCPSCFPRDRFQAGAIPLLLAASAVLSLTGGFTFMTSLRLLVDNMNVPYSEATTWLAISRFVDALWAVAISPVFDRIALLPFALGANVIATVLRAALASITLWGMRDTQDALILPLLMILTSADGVAGRAIYLQLQRTADSTQTFNTGETALSTRLFAYDYSLGNLGSFIAGIVFDLARTYAGTPATANVMMQLLGVGGSLLATLLIFGTHYFTQQGRHYDSVPTATPRGIAADATSFAQELRLLLRDRTLWRFTAFTLCLTGARSVMVHLETTLTEVMMRLYGKEVHFALIQSINPLLVVVGAPLLQHWLTPYKGYWVIAGGAALSGLSVLPLAASPPSPLNAFTIYSPYVAFVLVFSVGECIWSARLSSFGLSVAPADKRASYLALSALPLVGVRFVAAWHSGWMVDTYCPPGACNARALWAWVMGFGLLTPVLLVFGRRLLDPNRRQVEQLHVLKGK